MAHEYENQVVKTMLEQIGGRTVMAICGGKMERSGPLAVRMHAGCGYRVEVTYEEGTDTYTVERLYERSGRITVKGTRTDVYCDELSEAAWKASCWRDGSFGTTVSEDNHGGMVFS